MSPKSRQPFEDISAGQSAQSCCHAHAGAKVCQIASPVIWMGGVVEIVYRAEIEASPRQPRKGLYQGYVHEVRGGNPKQGDKGNEEGGQEQNFTISSAVAWPQWVIATRVAKVDTASKATKVR